MTWMCEKLELPDPEIRMAPEPALLAEDPDSYMEHVLEHWRTPLQDVADDRLETPEYPSRWQTRTASTRCWNTPSCIRFGMRFSSKS